MNVPPDELISKVIGVAEKRAMVLTGVAAVLAIGVGATNAVTISVPSFIRDMAQLDWKVLLALGPATAIVIAYILAAALWGVIISIVVWGASKLKYFSRLPHDVRIDHLSALESDALEVRLNNRIRKAGEWISCKVVGDRINYKVNVFVCSFVVLVAILVSSYVRAKSG